MSIGKLRQTNQLVERSNSDPGTRDSFPENNICLPKKILTNYSHRSYVPGNEQYSTTGWRINLGFFKSYP